MISTSDIEEPTWPRSPPCSVRTTRRRRNFERSSSGGLARVRVASARTAMSGVHFLRQGGKEAPRAVKLSKLGVAPAGGVAGQDAPLPALGQKLVEQDEHP